MCGLFGWQWTRSVPRKKRIAIAWALALEMDYRGGHSWGWFSSDDDGCHTRGLGHIAKRRNVHSMAMADNLIAHTRYATTGKVTEENAHPFAIGMLVGAHNGIVHNHAELNARHGRDCAVDSQHIFHHLNDDEPLNEIVAYGAITYQHFGSDDIFLGRFNGGELTVAQCKYGVFWASTKDAIFDAEYGARLTCDIVKPGQGREFVLHRGNLRETTRELNFAAPVVKRDWRKGADDWQSCSMDDTVLEDMPDSTDDVTFGKWLDMDPWEREFWEKHGYFHDDF